jgi:signal peptidase I
MDQEEEQKPKEETVPVADKQVSRLQTSLTKVGHFFIEFLKTAIIIGIIAFVIRYFVVQPFIVEGASMEPNFHNNDYLLIEKWSEYFADPKRGDVVVFRYPDNPSVNYIKRVIGIPGDKVTIKDGRVTVTTQNSSQGQVLNETYLSQGTLTSGNSEITLGKDEFFVLGDNRNNSSDSREWGVLPKKNIVGRAFIVIIPKDDFGLVHRVNYSL